MLDLLRTFAGAPAKGLQYLVLPTETLLLYPSADTVVILHADSLRLLRVLAFWEVFPGTQHAPEPITFLAVDPAMKLIVAAAGSRVAAWSLSGVQSSTWRVHSSLILPERQIVTALNCRSGLLALGSESSLAVYTLILENDLPTWSNKWSFSVTTPSRVRFSPSFMYIATTSQQDNVVRIYLTTSGRQTQAISHPRPLSNITWRHAQASSRDDLILYTITSDATLRIFMPVLDSPQHVQLHASLDLFSSIPSSSESSSDDVHSSVYWLDREIIGDSLAHILKSMPDVDDTKTRRVRDIKEDGWDLFLRVLSDGSIVVRAVANIDHRPPKLLKQFTLLQSWPSAFPRVPTHLYVLPNPGKSTLTLITSSPLSTLALEPLNFFDARAEGLTLQAQGEVRVLEEESRISRFVRTPDGKGVAVVRENGGEAWLVHDRGSKLVRSARWPAADHVVVLDGGRTFATYSRNDGNLTLHTTPPQALAIPSISSLFSLPPSSAGPHECIFGITSDTTPSILHIHAIQTPGPTLQLKSHTTLPLRGPAAFIVPVDPMAWKGASADQDHDVLLSVAQDGELMFWVQDDGVGAGWRSTGKVRTGRVGITWARCSSAKKSVLVVPGADGEELTIWDSKESEFASGLEYRKYLSADDPVNDLDWSSTPDNQSILAVGFQRHIEIICQQQMTYFDEAPGWGVIYNIDIGSLLPHPISDSIWLSHGSLLIGSGHQMCLYGQPRPVEGAEPVEGLFEHVTRLNGPLVDYHPQMLLQCLLWEKLELVKEIIVNLSRDLARMNDVVSGERKKFESTPLPVEYFLRKSLNSSTAVTNGQHRHQYNTLFANESDEEGFTRTLVESVLEQLEANPLPHLTANEHAHLLVLIQATLEVDESRRALDANGLRYLISMRSFYIINERSSAPSSPASKGFVARKTGWRARLRFRDMIWAFHSESQGLLLSAAQSACQGKMAWSDARATGVFIWLNGLDALKAHMEVIARTEYMAGDNRDPVACSLFFFALGKHKLVHGLWRQAAWHKEQNAMLKFLSNDFKQPRWRTAALKNAYALLSKQRFEYAAAFFLLGGSLRDAVNVCLRQLDDFQLAVALARIVEGSDDGPILQDILNKTIIPLSFRKGNRWLASWAFWLLHRRDLAVRILVTPLQDIASVLEVPIPEIGSPHYDDPSLALLFSQLKSKTLQTAKGTSEISGRVEFNFVLQIARVFTRMGCHVLALDLVRSWSFDRPSTVMHDPVQPETPPSPTSVRRMFALEPAMRRRSSIIIDMDVSTAPPTRRASPERSEPGEPALPTIKEAIKEEGDFFARKAGLGSLMKSAKQDVQVPEFDMNSFF
ncbi:WD repeat-containing protein [Auriscalpium vulgare]|uniref:WD repeat-containing protein n=1 Tax=Auriscalpium vulgare TaxID=40419 RepID=A0ACB8RDP5_9AGAM|nr:WD repeat-containing protein [Auriscalpium vulgare]